MVLLKNEKNTLPIRKGTKVALFGKGTVDYVKGGGGSGDVTVEYIRNLYEGMKIKEDEGKVEVFDKLAKYYEEDIQKQYADGAVPGMTVEPELPDELLNEAQRIYRYCSNYYLSFLGRRMGTGNVKQHRMDMFLTEKKKETLNCQRRFLKTVISV